VELVDPLQGMTTSSLKEEQGWTGVLRSGVNDAELYNRVGLNLDSNPVSIEFAHGWSSFL
jgi:hypothetical protein